jgi:hypothetical protein
VAIRVTLNKALTFIGQATLTDEEFTTLDLDDDASDLDQYNGLKSVINERGGTPAVFRRLASYYKAKGLTFSDDDEAPPAKTNVYMGSALE